MNAQVAYARLATIVYGLRMESVGLKTRGGSLRRRLADEFEMSPRAPHADFIAEAKARMALLLETSGS